MGKEMQQKVIDLVKNLYRAQGMIIEAYENHAKIATFPKELQQKIKNGLADHLRHKERLGKLLDDYGENAPKTTESIIEATASIKEKLSKGKEDYEIMLMDLQTEDAIIDAYDVGISLSEHYNDVVAVLNENKKDDARHASFFKEYATLFATAAAVEDSIERDNDAEIMR